MSGPSYVQGFDGLAPSGTRPWTNNVTLPGWYAANSGPTDYTTSYEADPGGAITGSLYSFGSVGVGERALGSIASNDRGDFAYGLRLLNDTGFHRTNITVSYSGEQWRCASISVQRLTFSYRVGLALTNSDADDSGNWVPVPSLDFSSPYTNAVRSALNGNHLTNRTSFSNITIPGLVVPAGYELFLRWFDNNDGGDDHALAIDELTVTFGVAITNVPGPAVGTFSLLTYNAQGNFVNTSNWVSTQLPAIGRQLSFLKPDIITFQEIQTEYATGMASFVATYLTNYSLATNSRGGGSIQSMIVSRFPILSSRSWLDNASLTNFGYPGTFTRDLFEAQIAVPGFPQPLHVFTTHLKATESGPNFTNSVLRRTAEARVISNFFANGYLLTNSLHPCVLTGDLNDDKNDPAIPTLLPLQILTSGTGLVLTSPLNPTTLSAFTHSIRGALDKTYDYILPNGLLYSNLLSSQVFRTDLLASRPPPLLAGDSVTASDHLPVFMVFTHPFEKEFRLLSLVASNAVVKLVWESVPGQPYCVEHSSDLLAWSALANDLMATQYTTTYMTNLAGAPGFFRVRRCH